MTPLPIRILAETEQTDVPVRCGVPFPAGLVGGGGRLRLESAEGAAVPLQTETTATHADGSVRWSLLTFRSPSVGPRGTTLTLHADRSDASSFSTVDNEDRLAVEIDRGLAFTLGARRIAATFRLVADGRTRDVTPTELRAERGHVRSAWEIEGALRERRRELRLLVRASHWQGTGLLRCDVRLHNPRRARHRGGLWDLGDSGSALFESFELRLDPGRLDSARWRPDRGGEPIDVHPASLYQDSSGGPNWRSRVHVDRNGRVPCRFQGYRLTSDAPGGKGALICEGLRADPLLHVTTCEDDQFAFALPEFWQNFPGRLATAEDGSITFAPFPAEWDGTHELQGGERKTRTLWIDLLAEEGRPSLAFVYDPPRVVLPAAWWERCGEFDAFASEASGVHAGFRELRDAALDGPRSLAAKKEEVDEFGWRSWGDLYADHERTHYAGSEPLVSHYNNQYDALDGLLRNYALTGDRRFWDLADPLARHVVDVDVYHSDRDRSVYSGGMFWHTDHYVTAATSTHRTFSASNAAPGVPYGGGPSSSHCYTAGLTRYYYLTGDPDSRDVVIGLAEWLIAAEDGSRTLLGIVDDGPTGTTSSSGFDGYQGPGRGPGNAVATLCNAWKLTGEDRYREHAETLIRRVIRPDDDFAELRLGDAENRWFYVVFLHALVTYLNLKIKVGENDDMYAYGVVCLRRYLDWMAAHETPWLDRPDRLEYPTETWAAQEIRKANAMRRGARFCDNAHSDRVLAKAVELADSGWSDLAKFETRFTLRPTVIALTEGARDAFYRTRQEPPAPLPNVAPRPSESRFVPQGLRVKERLRSPSGLFGAAVGALTKPSRLPVFINVIRRRSGS